MKAKAQISVAAMIAFVLSIAVFSVSGIVTVDPGEVGIKVKMMGDDSGMQDDTLDTGVHWISPITYDVYVYDARLRQYSAGLEDMPSQTKDGQPILVDVSLEIGLEPSKVPYLHQNVGPAYYERIVYPAVRSAIRNTTTLKLSDEIYTGDGRRAVQAQIERELRSKLSDYGISITVNLRDMEFSDAGFVQTLEQKAKAAQRVIIEARNAEAAEQEAIKVANIAEGAKQKAIKEAEAEAEKMRVLGIGERQQKEEQAKGILAIGKAEAETLRLRNAAMREQGAEYLVQMEWAKNLGPNVKVYGIPTGAPGTSSIMDLNGILQGALKGPKE